MARPGLKQAVLLALVAWAAWGFVAELSAVLAEQRAIADRAAARSPTRPEPPAPVDAAPPSSSTPPAAVTRSAALPPEVWRFDTRAVRRLRRCMSQVQAAVPDGNTIVVAAPGFDDSPYLLAWAAYLLPERRLVLRRDAPDSWAGATYALSYDTELADPRLGAPRAVACGWLYPVVRLRALEGLR